jgi:uncharacterized protein
MYSRAFSAVTTIVLTAAALAGTQGAAQTTAPEPPTPPQIVTTGHGESRLTPDRATLLIAVETRGATAAAAGSDNASRQRATLEALHALGLPKAQFSTAGYNVGPEYNYTAGKEPRVVDYVARNTVRAELHQLDQVGRAIDAALGAGATTVAGVQFSVSNSDSGRRVALSNAVAQARGDAETMARAAGGALGPLIELSSNGPSMPIPLMRMAQARSVGAAAMSETPTPVDAGDITITADVNSRWQFVPGRELFAVRCSLFATSRWQLAVSS